MLAVGPYISLCRDAGLRWCALVHGVVGVMAPGHTAGGARLDEAPLENV